MKNVCKKVAVCLLAAVFAAGSLPASLSQGSFLNGAAIVASAEETENEVAIRTQEDWDTFVSNVNSVTTTSDPENEYHYKGKTVRLYTDIEVTEIVGNGSGVDINGVKNNKQKYFSGVLDGNGHTITFNYNDKQKYAAPFGCVVGGTIKNLNVTGTINAGGKFASGLVACAHMGFKKDGDNVVIDEDSPTILENCNVNVTFKSTVNDGTHGMFIAIAESKDINGRDLNNQNTQDEFKKIRYYIKNCAFGGVIDCTSTNCGGFIGYNKATSYFDNCLFAPTEFNIPSDNLSSTFSRLAVGGTSYFNDSYSTVVWNKTDVGSNKVITADEKEEGVDYIAVTAVNGQTYYLKDITSAVVDLNESAFVYDGSEKSVSYDVNLNGTQLRKDRDWIEVEESTTASAADVGRYTVTVRGMGQYGGKISATWEIYNDISENLAGHSISLLPDNGIGVIFYMTIGETIAQNSDTHLHVNLPNGQQKDIYTNNGQAEEQAAKIVSQAGNVYYIFTCPVSAKEMADNITAQLICEDQQGKTYSYSVKEYGEYLLKNAVAMDSQRGTNDYTDAKPLVVAMLKYGAQAQNYFNYNTENPADAGLENIDYSGYYTDQPVDASTLTSDKFDNDAFSAYNLKYYGSSLRLKSKTSYIVYFDKLSSDQGLPTVKYDGQILSPISNNGHVGYEIKNINAGDLTKGEIKLTFGEEEKVFHPTSYFVIASKKNTAITTLTAALYNYDIQAYDYVHRSGI